VARLPSGLGGYSYDSLCLLKPGMDALHATILVA